MLFGKKKKQTAPAAEPVAVYTYPQTKNYRGFKRYKLSSYGYEPAQVGIKWLSGSDLSDATITMSIFMDYPRATFSVDGNVVGAIWEHSFDNFPALRDGKVSAVRLEIRDGDAYIFYKI